MTSPQERPVLRVTGRVLTGPGPEDVLDEIWAVDGRVSLTPPADTRDAVTVSGWALPGLIDAHCHIGLDGHGAIDAAAAEKQAVTEREAGVLLLRDAGSPSDTRWIDGREDLPRVIRAGRHIARPRRYIRNYGHEIDPAELPARVRSEARAGDGWVKLVGDWIDRERGDLAPCWPAGALREAIAAAHEEGARVTAHCFAAESLPDLLAAGVDCVEHATGLTAETVPAFAERGVAIVPTLVNIATFPDLAASGEGKFPRWAAHMRALHARRYETVRTAWEAGVPVYPGTDAGGTIPHGLIAREIAELVRAGIPAAEVVAAASWGGRAWLGRPGLTEGAPADLVVYAADPRDDVRVMAAPRRVVLNGRVVA